MTFIKQSLLEFLESQQNKLSKNPQPLDSTSVEIPIPSESSMLKIENRAGDSFSVSGVLEFGSDNYTNLALVRMTDMSDQLTGIGKSIFVTEVSGCYKIRIDIEGKPEDYIYALIV